MKFGIEDVEYETLPHESLVPVDPNGVTFEKVFEAKRKIRGLGEYLTEDIRKQVLVTLVPILEGDCNHDSAEFTLEQAVHIALSELVSLSGVGRFTLWIKGRRYGEWDLDQKLSCSSDVYAAIDLDMGLGPEEWFGR